MDETRTVECRERFSDLVQRAVNLGDGNHTIKVGEVLDLGMHSFHRSQTAIIKDSQNRILLIPEDKKCDGRNRLASRWVLKKNMSLYLTVEEGKTLDVFIGDSS
jgi:hypothetical protein